MKTAFEVLFMISMIVPPAAVVVGMGVLFGALRASGRGRARHTAAAHPEGIALAHPVGH